jgi:hypothetical protein
VPAFIGVGFKRRFVGLCAPPLALGALDGLLTVLGQSSVYWTNHAATNEANPVFSALLQAGPLAFLLVALLWLAMLGTMILVLPRLPALILSLAISFGHTVGSGSWLFDHFELGYHLANGYYLASASLLGVGILHAIGHQAEEPEVIRASPGTRLKIGGTVFALSVLLFLFPWQR